MRPNNFLNKFKNPTGCIWSQRGSRLVADLPSTSPGLLGEFVATFCDLLKLQIVDMSQSGSSIFATGD